MKQPLKAVDELLHAVEKQFGKGAMMRLGDRKAERVPCIPTGSPSLDEALGCGGYPKGRVVEVFGPESSGKPRAVSQPSSTPSTPSTSTTRRISA